MNPLLPQRERRAANRQRLAAEIELVRQVGEDIGYGHLMSLASALWRKKLRDTGAPESGAFVATGIIFVDENRRDVVEESTEQYDGLIKKAD